MIAYAREFGAKLGRLPGRRTDDCDQIVSEMADSALDYLNGLDGLPPYCSFSFDDNSLFLFPDVESARESVDFVSRKERDETTDEDDPAFPARDFRGEWLHVSDHGNATLYLRESVNPAAFASRGELEAKLTQTRHELTELTDDESGHETARQWGIAIETLPGYRETLRAQLSTHESALERALAFTDREIWARV